MQFTTLQWPDQTPHLLDLYLMLRYVDDLLHAILKAEMFQMQF